MEGFSTGRWGMLVSKHLGFPSCVIPVPLPDFFIPRSVRREMPHLALPPEAAVWGWFSPPPLKISDMPTGSEGFGESCPKAKLHKYILDIIGCEHAILVLSTWGQLCHVSLSAVLHCTRDYSASIGTPRNFLGFIIWFRGPILCIENRFLLSLVMEKARKSSTEGTMGQGSSLQFSSWAPGIFTGIYSPSPIMELLTILYGNFIDYIVCLFSSNLWGTQTHSMVWRTSVHLLSADIATKS